MKDITFNKLQETAAVCGCPLLLWCVGWVRGQISFWSMWVLRSKKWLSSVKSVVPQHNYVRKHSVFLTLLQDCFWSPWEVLISLVWCLRLLIRITYLSLFLYFVWFFICITWFFDFWFFLLMDFKIPLISHTFWSESHICTCALHLMVFSGTMWSSYFINYNIICGVSIFTVDWVARFFHSELLFSDCESSIFLAKSVKSNNRKMVCNVPKYYTWVNTRFFIVYYNICNDLFTFISMNRESVWPSSILRSSQIFTCVLNLYIDTLHHLFCQVFFCCIICNHQG